MWDITVSLLYIITHACHFASPVPHSASSWAADVLLICRLLSVCRHRLPYEPQTALYALTDIFMSCRLLCMHWQTSLWATDCSVCIDRHLYELQTALHALTDIFMSYRLLCMHWQTSLWAADALWVSQTVLCALCLCEQTLQRLLCTVNIRTWTCKRTSYTTQQGSPRTSAPIHAAWTARFSCAHDPIPAWWLAQLAGCRMQ